jgi:hypothetical protein
MAHTTRNKTSNSNDASGFEAALWPAVFSLSASIGERDGVRCRIHSSPTSNTRSALAAPTCLAVAQRRRKPREDGSVGESGTTLARLPGEGLGVKDSRERCRVSSLVAGLGRIAGIAKN